MQSNATQRESKQSEAKQSNAKQSNAKQCDVMRLLDKGKTPNWGTAGLILHIFLDCLTKATLFEVPRPSCFFLTGRELWKPTFVKFHHCFSLVFTSFIEANYKKIKN